MKKVRLFQLLVFGCFLMATLVVAAPVGAQEKNITLEDDTNSNYWYSWFYDDEDETYYNVGDTGMIQIDYTQEWLYGPIARKEFVSSDPAVVQVDAEGRYTVLSGGKADVTVKCWNAEETEVFSASCQFKVCSDVSGMTLGKSSVSFYLFNSGYSWYGSQSETVYVPLVNAPDLTYHTFSSVAADSSMDVSCSLDTEEKTLAISVNDAGTTTLTVTINGKVFSIHIKATTVSINKSSSLLSQKQKTSLKLKGYSGKVKWTSTNKSVASVSSGGTIKGKKVGNAVVYATIGDHRLGCAVSVVTPKMKKVVNHAKKIAQTCTYSQAQRMSDKYYDCSSLVWKAYRKIGKTFGNRNYAPVAADIGKWCGSHKKFIKGGCSEKNISSMKLRPGDLLFKTGGGNGRYKGIYHVEMFVGYQCYGFNGTEPILGTLWAARSENYGGGGYLMGRP